MNRFDAFGHEISAHRLPSANDRCSSTSPPYARLPRLQVAVRETAGAPQVPHKISIISLRLAIARHEQYKLSPQRRGEPLPGRSTPPANRIQKGRGVCAGGGRTEGGRVASPTRRSKLHNGERSCCRSCQEGYAWVFFLCQRCFSHTSTTSVQLKIHNPRGRVKTIT